jgi:hypothetical protein
LAMLVLSETEMRARVIFMDSLNRESLNR